MRISDWSSDVCSSDLEINGGIGRLVQEIDPDTLFLPFIGDVHVDHQLIFTSGMVAARPRASHYPRRVYAYETLSETNWYAPGVTPAFQPNMFVDISGLLPQKLEAFGLYRSQVTAFPNERSRSEEHTSELQSLMRISYA